MFLGREIQHKGDIKRLTEQAPQMTCVEATKARLSTVDNFNWYLGAGLQ